MRNGSGDVASSGGIRILKGSMRVIRTRDARFRFWADRNGGSSHESSPAGELLTCHPLHGLHLASPDVQLGRRPSNQLVAMPSGPRVRLQPPA